jgi:hypothetical protein
MKNTSYREIEFDEEDISGFLSNIENAAWVALEPYGVIRRDQPPNQPVRNGTIPSEAFYAVRLLELVFFAKKWLRNWSSATDIKVANDNHRRLMRSIVYILNTIHEPDSHSRKQKIIAKKERSEAKKRGRDLAKAGYTKKQIWAKLLEEGFSVELKTVQNWKFDSKNSL